MDMDLDLDMDMDLDTDLDTDTDTGIDLNTPININNKNNINNHAQPQPQPQPSPSLLSKFEDSPVFNYISSLSPIKQFSLSHNAQTFHLLSFVSPQSLQTPPPINCPNVSNFKSSNLALDASMSNSSQDDSVSKTAEKPHTAQPCDLHLKEDKFILGNEEVYVTVSNEPNKLANEFAIVKRGCASSEGDELGTETLPANVIQDVPKEEALAKNQEDMQRIEVENNEKMCEWETFICEASDIFNCHSPTNGTIHENHHERNDDSKTLSFIKDFLHSPNENIVDSQKIESLCPLNSSENHGGARKPEDTSHVSSPRARAVIAEEVVHHMKTEVNDKSSTEQQTTRRRCLVYEVSGSHYRKCLSDSTSGSPICNSSASLNPSNEKKIVASKPGSGKLSSQLPGIGLHLNALAASGREKIIVKRENLTCRRQLLSAPRTMSSLDSNIQEIGSPHPPLASEVVERACEAQKDDTYLNENVCENSALVEAIVVPQSSPKKKRKKTDNVGEPDSCKRCNCRRSKCLKLYCECFAAGLYCVEPCNCHDCLNKPAHEDIVLETRRQIESRNPLAFAPKVVTCSGTPSSINALNKTPASARHKRGCNCKKSGCLKKYCECFQGGVGCSPSCRCEGCKNTFGCKEGIIFEEASILHKFASDARSVNKVSETSHENQATPEPSNNERQLVTVVRPPFHLDAVAPQFPLLQSCTTQKTDDSDHTVTVGKQDLVPDDEATEPLEGDDLLPTTNVKSTSPNSKRISSHHHEFETSPGWKSCRKLILRSVPSFLIVPVEQQNSETQEKLQ